MSTEVKKCAHEICNCVSPKGEKYCSPYCEDSKNVTSLKCDCHHSECEAVAL